MSVRDYYESNTKRFLRHGVGKGEYAIHRPVYGPGVTNRSEALHYAENRILEILKAHAVKTVIDLGCGVGGTIRYLYPSHNAVYHGLTLSPLQTEIGSRVLADTPCDISTGDMTDPTILREITANTEHPRAYVCIEAYLHLPPTSNLIQTISEVSEAGDIIIIQDDFLAQLDIAEKHPLVRDFIKGWKAANLDTDIKLQKRAKVQGFTLESETDLTPFLGPKRLTNHLITLLVTLLKPFGLTSSWWDNFLGGDALQRCLSKGLIQYRQMTFIKG